MRKTTILIGILSLWLFSSPAHADFVSGSTGALGAFNPTSNTVVTLPPAGVLNYTTVNIPAGVTVTFTKNAANTPVYMLATGDVTIAGTLSVNGGNTTGTGATAVGLGGPGGFDGGYGGTSYEQGGKGLGPGGGSAGTFNGTCQYGDNPGGGGGFGTDGSTLCGAGGKSYGNPRLYPLVGGSGGGGAGGPRLHEGGGGGGGAILVASSGTVLIAGSITANGGTAWAGGGGSGGGIRLVGNTVSGNGRLSAAGGEFGYIGRGGAGRIRMEAYSNNATFTTNPAPSYGSPGNVFVAAEPTLSITSVAGTHVPATPTGSYTQPDITLPSGTSNPVAVNVSAANVPMDATVKVWVVPQYGTATSADATRSGTQEASTAIANVTISTTYPSVITAETTVTIVGLYHDGEEIEKVRVAATMGGKSERTYITKSGKEIKGNLLAALTAR